MMISMPKLLFPLDFAGTLCARDGIKTGSGTPNGEDAYDRKLVAMKRKRGRCEEKDNKTLCYENHQTDSRVKEIDVAATMGASRNANCTNYNPLVLMVLRRRDEKNLY